MLFIARVSLALTGSCGHVIDKTPDSMTLDDPVVPQLFAITPTTAGVGTMITLEGTFGNASTVMFPGGVAVSATVLGPHRATVTIPDAASTGDLIVQSGSSKSEPLPFRRVSFAPNLGAFAAMPTQASVGRQRPVLAAPRSQHATVTVGNSLYVLGGMSDGNPTSSVERARVDVDGALGAFAAVNGISLTTPRYGHSAAVIGHMLYLVGGHDSAGVLATVEAAPIQLNGALGSFAPVAAVSLTTARYNHTTTVIGNSLYTLGGVDAAGKSLRTIERAEIRADGTLSSFSTVSDATLATARTGHTTVGLHDKLYVVGGFDGNAQLASIEQASIRADGTLSPFVLSTAVLTTARSGHASVVIGDALYILGGVGSAGALSSVERAHIERDGRLSAFAVMPGAALVAKSSGHTSTILGNYVYVIGGLSDTGPNGINWTSIAAGSVLSTFAAVPRTLAIARYSHISVVLGRHLYILGGYGNTYLGSVEHAAISADGSFESFTTMPDVKLVTPRRFFASAVIGNYLYVIGGQSGAALASVERAAISADGLLGPFTTVQGVSLSIARHSFRLAVIGDFLYAIGGQATSGPLGSIERAAIQTDGSLGAFSTVSSSLENVRYGHGSVVLGPYLYILGGSNAAGLMTIERALATSASLGSFTVLPDVRLSTPRSGFMTATVGDAIYAIGVGGAVSMDRSLVGAGGALGPFSLAAESKLASPRVHSGSVLIENYLYALGGFVPVNMPGNSVERAVLRTPGP